MMLSVSRIYPKPGPMGLSVAGWATLERLAVQVGIIPMSTLVVISHCACGWMAITHIISEAQEYNYICRQVTLCLCEDWTDEEPTMQYFNKKAGEKFSESEDIEWYCKPFVTTFRASIGWEEGATGVWKSPIAEMQAAVGIEKDPVNPSGGSGPVGNPVKSGRSLKPRNVLRSGRSFERQLIVTANVNHTVTETCLDDKFMGPDLANTVEMKFCDMATRVVYDICVGDGHHNTCFDVESLSLRKRGQKIARGFSSYERVQRWEA